MVDGVRMHVLEVPEMTIPDAEGLTQERVQNARLFIEPDKWAPRRMTFDAEAEVEPGRTETVSPEIRLDDYRNVEGMWIPYRTTMIMEIGEELLGPEQREEAQRQLAQMETQLEQMPEQQRDMMEQMMGNQLDQLRQMLDGERMEWTIHVEEVKVNTGLPDHLFE